MNEMMEALLACGSTRDAADSGGVETRIVDLRLPLDGPIKDEDSTISYDCLDVSSCGVMANGNNAPVDEWDVMGVDVWS